MPKREGLKLCCHLCGKIVSLNFLLFSMRDETDRPFIICGEKCFKTVDPDSNFKMWVNTRPSADLEPLDVGKVELELCRAKQNWISFEVDGKTLQRAQAEAIVQLSTTPRANTSLGIDEINKIIQERMQEANIGLANDIYEAIHFGKAMSGREANGFDGDGNPVVYGMSGGATNPAPISPLRWFLTPNPMLGGLSPMDMINNGRAEKLCKWVKDAISENGDLVATNPGEGEAVEVYVICYKETGEIANYEGGLAVFGWPEDPLEPLSKYIDKDKLEIRKMLISKHNSK